MLNKEIMVKAHQMTREIKSEFPMVDYKVQLGLCISYLLEEEKEEVVTYGNVVDALEEAEKELGMNYSKINKWEKGDKKRAYLELRYYRDNGRCATTIKCGYWDYNTNEYVSFDKYNKIYDLIKKEYV